MNILIVDENNLFREGLCGLIRRQALFKEVGEANSVIKAIEVAAVLEPEVVLVSCYLPDGSGLDVIRSIQPIVPAARVVILTHVDDSEIFFAALHAGVKGYLSSNISSKELLDALTRIARGEAVIQGQLLDMLLEAFVQRGKEQNRHNSTSELTARELEVLNELVLEASNQQIAERLFLSENTVKNHVHNILSKLKLHNRREAISYARSRFSRSNSAGDKQIGQKSGATLTERAYVD